jgi:hypothetical protein
MKRTAGGATSRRSSPGNVVGPPGWCGAILSHLCAFNGQAGEDCRRGGDCSDDGDYVAYNNLHRIRRYTMKTT